MRPLTPCNWIYRPGIDGKRFSHFAVAECDGSLKYLSKIPPQKPCVGVADFYNGRRCPSCDHPIKMNYSILEKGVVSNE